MTIEKFLKSTALVICGTTLCKLLTRKYEVKTGLIYESEGNYIVVYYDIPKDGCFILRLVKYNKDFEEIENNECYSEDDIIDQLDSLKELKESNLNKELIGMFQEIISYIKPRNILVN